MLRCRIIIVLLFGYLFSQCPMPTRYSLEDTSTPTRLILDGWPSKYINDLRYGPEGSIFASTGGGLAKILPISSIPSTSEIEDNLHRIIDSDLPIGSNPSLQTYFISEEESLVITAGIIAIPDEDAPECYGEHYYQAGTGIAWSLNGGEKWYYISQPLDSSNEEYECVLSDPETTCFDAEWNGFPYEHVAYKDEQRIGNVAFDVAADTNHEYIYVANWYGMLRRFSYRNLDNPTWESVPLPMNFQDHLGCDLRCDPTQTINYDSEADPVDPLYGCCTEQNPWSDCDPDYYYNSGPDDNQKPFSVYIEDGYIWVGTADGLNRGEIIDENCINWTHYNTQIGNGANYEESLHGFFVIGVHGQKFENHTRIWAITWEGGGCPPPPHVLNYTDDNGATWHHEEYLKNQGAVTYNFYSIDDLDDEIDAENKLYASTTHGLFQFENDEWSKVEIPTELLSEEGIADESDPNFSVYTAIEENGNLFIGTSDGLFVRDDDGDFYHPSYINAVLTGTLQDMLVYPNPYLLDTHNHASFLIETTNSGTLEIYDFSMSKVFNTDCNAAQEYLQCKWPGLNNNGERVANGVYFCKVQTGGKTYWEKLGVIKYK